MTASADSGERGTEGVDTPIDAARIDTHSPSLSAFLSRTMGAARRETLDGAVEACLAHIGAYTGADMAFVMVLDETEYVSQDWYWVRPGETYRGPGVGTPIALLYASSVELLRLGHLIVVSDLSTIEISPIERRAADVNDLRSLVLAPVRLHGVLLGLCGLQAFHEPREWEREVVNQLALLAEQLVQGVSRTLERGELALADARARRIAEFIPDGLALLDLDGVVTWASPSLVRMSGRTIRLLVGRRAVELVRDEDRQTLADGLAAATAEPARLVVRMTTPDGWRWAELTWRVVSEPAVGVPDEIVLGVRDVHERQLEWLAMTALTRQDELTGAANRGGLARRLDQLAAQGTTVLYAFVDLDEFKDVNDTYGHAEGDLVLAQTAEALRSVLRHEDVVARVGGDEFAVVIAQPLDPATLGDRLLAAIRGVEVGGHAVTASIGIAGPMPASDPHLTQLADKAMYEAKRCGKDRWAHMTADGPLATGRDGGTGDRADDGHGDDGHGADDGHEPDWHGGEEAG